MPARKNKSINLIPKEDFERTTLGRIMKWALTSFRFIVIVVEFIVIVGFIFRFWFDVQVNNLDDEIAQKSALISSRLPFEREYRDIQAKVSIYKTIANSSNESLPSLQLVAQNMPNEIRLLGFAKKRGTLEVTGDTLSETSILSFVNNLQKTDQFSSIKIQKVNSSTDNITLEFTLELVSKEGGA